MGAPSALSIASYYLVANPSTMARLYAELETAIPDPSTIPPTKTLEQLPYLISSPLLPIRSIHPLSRPLFPRTPLIHLHSAVLHEALRFSCGIASRIPRVPHETLHYTGTHAGRSIQYTIPARTTIGMSTYLMHNLPDVYPEPKCWRPERWLDEQGKRHRDLDAYFMAFSKGSRQCLGIK